MKLKKVEIDGFGKLVNRSYEFEELTIFMGANEAGKSTLLSFIKYMIFGFENKTTKNRDFTPKDSRVYGGRIYLEIDGKDLVIERIKLSKSGSQNFEGRYIASGQKLTETDWQDLVSPMTPKLFDQIYSVTQDNLQINQEKDYDEESLEEKWRMALTTGSVELYTEEQEILREKNQIYTSPRALTKPLNKLLLHVDQIKEKILAKEAEELTLAPLIKAGARREQEIKESRLKLAELEGDKRFLQAKLAAKVDYLELTNLRDQLKVEAERQEKIDYDKLLASYHNFEILQSRIGRLEDKIAANERQLEKFNNPRDNFLLEDDTRSLIRQIELLYPEVIGKKEKQVKTIERSNTLLLGLMFIVLATLVGLIFLPAGMKIFLSILLVFEIIFSMVYLLTSSKKWGKINEEAKNSQATKDYFELTDYFRDWYRLPEGIEGRYNLILEIKERILELIFNYESLDNRENDRQLKNLYAKSDVYLRENPQLDQVQEEIKLHETFIQQKKYLVQEERRLDQLFDFGEKVEPDFDQMAKDKDSIDQKIDQLGNQLSEQIDQNSLILVKIDQQKSDQSLENLYQELELKRSELSDMLSDYLLKEGQIESLRAATQSLSTYSLPEILTKASHYLSILTDGKWEELKISKGLLKVSGPSLKSIRLLDLSTGTRDQLQLAVRLAFIEAKNLNFPVFFDDSFLRYDGKRKENFIKLLEEFSESVQTFVFTSDEKFRNQGDLIEL
ncbi:AAA family ATPase [Streptococcaceae bacterium ESL0687]|nr:AAA family ATPase [Streptococcaceae bacterium ESL0687]